MSESKSSAMSETTFAQYEDALCDAAKEIQGENYAGDDYYRQGESGPWHDNWQDGMRPEDAVWDDMGYWDY
jgi:hypothetical protein